MIIIDGKIYVRLSLETNYKIKGLAEIPTPENWVGFRRNEDGTVSPIIEGEK